MSQFTLNDILTSEVDCISPETSLKSVFKILTDNNYSCCVIADDDHRIPLGLLTERDLVRIISLNSSDPRIMERPVADYMLTSPPTVAQDMLVADAIKYIEQKKLKHLLVTSAEGTMLGIVTRTNIVNAYTQLMRIHSEELESKIEKRTELLEATNRKLITLSMIDPLTGLGNRRSMEVDIMKVHAAGIRHGRPYSIVLLDIDYFKKYNDHYGHQAGDKVLEAVSSHFAEAIRESDAVYRYGGEEFLLVMPDTNIDEALIPVKRIIEGLADLNIEHTESPLGYLTTSAGLACSRHLGQRLASWRQVVERADEGLYDAKSAGRNRVLVSQRNALKAVN